MITPGLEVVLLGGRANGGSRSTVDTAPPVCPQAAGKPKPDESRGFVRGTETYLYRRLSGRWLRSYQPRDAPESATYAPTRREDDMDPNEANNYAKQLEVEGSAVYERTLNESVPPDQLIQMGCKLAESMQYRRALGQVGSLYNGTCELVLTAGEFGGQESFQPSTEPHSIGRDWLVRVVGETVYDNAYAIGTVRSLAEVSDDEIRIVYRPRFGGFVQPLEDDERRAELDRKTRWLAALSTREVIAVLRQLDAVGRTVRDVTRWSLARDKAPALVELADLSGILVWPDGKTSVQTVGWSGE